MEKRWDPWVKVQTGLVQAGPRMPVMGPAPLKVTVAPSPYDAKEGVRSLFVGIAFALAAAYHGYRRSGGSKLWAIPWAVGGFVCPVITLPLAINQGFAKKKG